MCAGKFDRRSCFFVSMESGLEDRNNPYMGPVRKSLRAVSMESGLEDRNNAQPLHVRVHAHSSSLNGVRPRRPEQCPRTRTRRRRVPDVSMESGLEDRNNYRNIVEFDSTDKLSQWSPA